MNQDIGRISFIADLPIDGKYILREVTAPDGYEVAEDWQVLHGI